MSTGPLNREAFQKAIGSVERRPDELFSMKAWGKPTPCGTICCVFGSFIEDHGEEYGVRLVDDAELPGLLYPTPYHGKTDAIDIAADIFGISYDDAEAMFVPSDMRNVDRATAIRRLKKYLADHSETAAVAANEG